MDGLIGDILKTIVGVMLALALLSLLIFFFHLQSLSHYQHSVNSILQHNSTEIVAQDQFNGSSNKNSTAYKLNQLDREYNWMFTIQPRDSKSKYYYGDQELYTVNAHIPLFFNDISEGDYQDSGKQFSDKKPRAIYNTKATGETVCELEQDNDPNDG